MDTVTVVKIAALAVMAGAGRRYIEAEYILYNNFSPAHRAGRGVRLIIFNYVYFGAAISPLLAPFIENPIARVFLVLYFVLSAIALVAYRSVSGAHVDKRVCFDDDVLELLWRERNMAGAAFRTYARHVIPVFAIAAVATAVFLWPPKAPFSGDYLPVLIPVTALGGIFLVALTRWAPPFPTISRIPIQLLVHIIRKDIAHPKVPNPVAIRARQRPYNKVIFIMDESVRGDYLSLTNPALGTTPYLASLGDRLIDLGVTVSSHNCSSYSRYIFRYGARPDDLRFALADGLNFEGPNIWQYARTAGFKTVHIDGFSTERRWLHSGMTLQESSFVEQHVPVGEAKTFERDLAVADRLLEALRDPDPAFIYVDKYGLHSPYDDKYPSSAAHFPSSGCSRRNKLIAEYKNGVRWNVDGFFRKIVPQIDFTTTALFYTSDHGQSLMDKGYEGTHGRTTPDVAAGEALVPMFVMVENEPLRSELVAGAKRCRNQASHFELFPVLLAAFGYDRDDVTTLYGQGLFGEPPASRRFLIGFKRTATWVPINEEEVVGSQQLSQAAAGYETILPSLHVCVVSRDQDASRRSRMSEHLARHGITFSFFSAIDAERGDHLEMSRHIPSESRGNGGCVLAPCEIGCFASHYALWQQCASGERTYLILEDDVEIMPGFREQLLAAMSLTGRGVVRLGFNPSGNRPLIPTTEKFGGERVFLCPPGSTYGTFGYALSPTMASCLLAKAGRWTEPVDHYLEATDKHGVINFSFDVPTLKHQEAAIAPSTMTTRRLQQPFTPLELVRIGLRRQWQRVTRA